MGNFGKDYDQVLREKTNRVVEPVKLVKEKYTEATSDGWRGEDIDVIDERPVGKYRIVLMQTPDNTIRSVTLLKNELNKYNRNNPRDIEKLWNLSLVTEATFNEYFETDESIAEELILFINNDQQLYKQQFIPIIKNIMRKIKRGVYDHSKAPKLWLYLMDNAAKRYAHEFAEPGARWMDMFPKKIRMLAAQMKADREIRRIEDGEYDHLMESLIGSNIPEGIAREFVLLDMSRTTMDQIETASQIGRRVGATLDKSPKYANHYEMRVLTSDDLHELTSLLRQAGIEFKTGYDESIQGDPHMPQVSNHPTTIADALASMDDDSWNEITQAVFNTPGNQINEETVLQRIIETNKVSEHKGMLEFWIDSNGEHTVTVYDSRNNINTDALLNSSEGWSNDDAMRKQGMGSIAKRVYNRFANMPSSYVTPDEAQRLLQQSVDMVREHEGEQSAKMLENELSILWGMKQRTGTVRESIKEQFYGFEEGDTVLIMRGARKGETGVIDGFGSEIGKPEYDIWVEFDDGEQERYNRRQLRKIKESISELRQNELPSELFIVKDEVDKTVHGVFKDKNLAFMLAKQKTSDLHDVGRIHDAKIYRVSKPHQISSYVDIAAGGQAGGLIVQTDLFESINEQIPDTSDDLRVGTYQLWSPEQDDWIESEKRIEIRPGESVAAVQQQISAKEGTQARLIIIPNAEEPGHER